MGDTRHLDTMRHLLLLLLTVLTQVWTEKVTEKVKAPVKVGKKKFSCSFTLVSEEDQVLFGDSKVSCTPNKPTKKKVSNFEISTDKAKYTLSFNINPEKLTKAAMTLKEEKTVACEAGFTRV